MTDYFEKARQGRIIALNLHQSGAVMFFPEDMEDAAMTARPSSHHIITQVSKPMFVRSASITSGAMIDAPRLENVANTPLVLTEEHAVSAEDAVENVLHLVA
ncbi:hypothetical protein [Celeribacter sp. PS-C1]|uniref:hypothetical protein n=1 Tax=Celeribacter sp. PS-C1 TaxID=2820813 RepID=UPI001CA47CB2|nr:hypothetical protein [Celeribacter sp. PS-C1]MBW6416470.1 hypothetical protein [Celeribacter sp. PS-C1]